MDYLLCLPEAGTISRETCEKVHNILARMSDKYKIQIVPEPVKFRQSSCPAYYRKYRIYKEIHDKEGNGEAFLLKEEEDMILSVCKDPQEMEIMKNCIYAYRYPASMVLKSFRDKDKKKREVKEAEGNGAREGGRRENGSRDHGAREKNVREGGTGENNGGEGNTKENSLRESGTKENNEKESGARESGGRENRSREGRGREGNRENRSRENFRDSRSRENLRDNRSRRK